MGLVIAGILAAGLTLPASPLGAVAVAHAATENDSSTAVQSLVTKVSSNQANDSATSSESVSNLTDQNMQTKWYEGSGSVPSASSPVYAVYTLSEAATAVGYTITSANDSQERDPKDWTVLGTNDSAAAADPTGDGWTQLDTRSGESFSQRHETDGFSIADSGAYKYYQLRVTADQGGTNQFQVADWTLVGTASTTASLVNEKTSWSYWDTTDSQNPKSDPTGGAADRTSWTTGSLGAEWKTGTGSFGVKKASDGSDSASLGDGYTATTRLTRALGSDGIVPSYFFRTTVNVTQAQLSSMKGLVGSLSFDDTATVYVNGVRVTGFDDSSVSSNTAALDFGGQGDPQSRLLTIPTSMLQTGENVIAVEVHQCNDTSSDAWFDMPELSWTSDYLSLSYTQSERSRSYSSNAWPTTSNGKNYFVDLLSDFSTLRDHPELWSSDTNKDRTSTLTDENDKKLVEINNGASSAQVQKAITDANNSPTQTEYDGFGTRLGKLYLSALNSGKLPKTAELLGGLITNGIDQHDTAKSTYAETRPYDRLGFYADGGWIMPGNISYGFHNDSFPSGHTTSGYVTGTTLATLLPELAPQLLERASEYGNNRIVLGFHYPIDVMGGRIGGQAMVGYRWSDTQFQSLLKQAHAELESVLLQSCEQAGYGSTITACASDADSTESAVKTYQERLTYGLSKIDANAKTTTLATYAKSLLLTKYPTLTDAQRNSILEQTALQSGYVFDANDTDDGSWQRIDLAAALSAKVTVNKDGSVSVNASGTDDSGSDDSGSGSDGDSSASPSPDNGANSGSGTTASASASSSAATEASASASAASRGHGASVNTGGRAAATTPIWAVFGGALVALLLAVAVLAVLRRRARNAGEGK